MQKIKTKAGVLVAFLRLQQDSRPHQQHSNTFIMINV